MDRGAWQVTVDRVTQSQTQLKQLNTCTVITRISIGEYNNETDRGLAMESFPVKSINK